VEPIVLRTAIDRYEHTQPLYDGTVASPRIRFDFADVSPISRAFRRMAEGAEFDVSEMAIVTYLQAREAGKRLALLPVVMLNRFHHASIVVNNDSPIVSPRQLNGARIGVRAYTQTTGLWVRGVLAEDYGVDLDSITWVTDEAAHIDSYVDPSNTERVEGASQVDMLRRGEIAAWIGGREAAKFDGLRPIIADAPAAERSWYERVGALPINHMLVVKQSIVDEHPWLLDELFSLLTEAKARAFTALRERGGKNNEERFQLELLSRGIDPLPSGINAVRRSLEIAIDYACAQHLIVSRPAVNELFDARLA
jgi:4,5-dihydroxyphthalate decarboxylase